ncbi:ABC transporter substrate-binding protein [Mameliella alba]|uniref:ABC transporter substrate-binding protein n=1 Tax=Mameliella alba TaxID=561184 RepID=UPI00315845A1
MQFTRGRRVEKGNHRYCSAIPLGELFQIGSRRSPVRTRCGPRQGGRLMKVITTATAFILGSAAFAHAADKVTFQMDWLPGGDKAAIFVCLERGFCEKAGLELSLETGRGSSESLTKLATGSSDIGNADIGALMAARVTEKLPVTAVMSYYNEGPHAFFTLKGNGIESFADVKGKDVVTSPFTSSNVYLPLVLHDNDLTMDDITLTKSDPGALNPMLVTGRTDAVISWITDVTRYSQQARDAGREMIVLPWADAGLVMYSGAIVASDKFLEERPDVARRFVGALLESVEYMRANPDDAAKAVTDAVPELDHATALGSLQDALGLIFNDVTERDGLGAFDPVRLKATWERVAAAQGMDLDALDPEDIVDRSFMPGN